MKITDGKRTVEINIMTWNGTGYGPDWAGEYFDAGTLPYDEENDAYTVQDVQYCINARRGKSTCNARWVVWRGVTCLHRALAALGRPARYSFGCFALRAPHHRGFARRPLLWAVL